jgi:hypothetical protein
MLYASLTYTGKGAIAGVIIMVAGVPVWFLADRYQKGA